MARSSAFQILAKQIDNGTFNPDPNLKNGIYSSGTIGRQNKASFKKKENMGEDEILETKNCPVDDDDDVKVRINELAYPLVPGTMTIDEFEDLTCKIFDLIMEARHKNL